MKYLGRFEASYKECGSLSERLWASITYTISFVLNCSGCGPVAECVNSSNYSVQYVDSLETHLRLAFVKWEIN